MDGGESWQFLGELLLLLGGAVAAGAALEAIGVSAIIGYLLAGVVLGPGLTGIITDVESFELVAELGVALLLFSIGLEMTPAKLRGFGLRGMLVGFIQVGLTLVTAGGVSWAFGFGLSASIVLGCMVAMSSTAVVVRLLVDRGELDAPRGRESLSVLLAQDVAVVPMLVMVGILGTTARQEGGNIASEATKQLADAALGLLLVVGVLAAVGVFILPRLLGASVFRRNRDFAIVIAIITCMVAAWSSHALGLSPALGAFVAGIVLARVSFARQIRADTGALRAVFLTLFFASIGLLARIRDLLDIDILVVVVGILVIGLAIKVLMTWLAVRLTGGHRVAGVGAAICLAQFGEFSFVVGSEARSSGVLSESLFQAAIGASLISLLATPILVARSRSISIAVNRLLVRLGLWKAIDPQGLDEVEGMSDHVVVIGFGPAGEEAARTVRLAGMEPYVLEMNASTVRRVRAEGIHADIGDGASREILEHVHASDASAFIVTLPDPEAAIAAVHQIRGLNADAVIVVRGRYSRRVPELVAAGADHVLDEESTVGTLLGATVVKSGTGLAVEGEETWPRPRDRAAEEDQ
ncbi:MAG: cation:proton antiporter [Planctomycetota bacterium]|nr:cation:proton antiporter [Planctomycetota bacterium]